jgi:hypothetical protein
MNAKINHKKTGLSDRIVWILLMIVVVTFVDVNHVTAASQQKTFASGQEAAAAFVQALKEENNEALLSIFGADANDLISSGDPVADRARRDMFVKAYEEKHLLNEEADKLILTVGRNDWPFPIPLIRQGQQWMFNTAAGMEEILNRRIGVNELNTIQVMLAIVDAQREYAMMDHDRDGLLEYAKKFKSDPGTQNGLYWENKEGHPASPLGLFVAQAKRQGYEKSSEDKPQPYYGYIYRILTGQGENASGGAFDYSVNDNMIGGFAVIACPAEYGNSGVMTFIVNYDGVVFQKDLGEETEQAVRGITFFDPDKSWTKIQ